MVRVIRINILEVSMEVTCFHVIFIRHVKKLAIIFTICCTLSFSERMIPLCRSKCLHLEMEVCCPSDGVEWLNPWPGL